MQLIPFAELMERPDVVAEASNPNYSCAGCPEWLNRFMVLTMMCTSGEPEMNVAGGGYIGSGCAVFYAVNPEWGPDVRRYEPWTCEIVLGGSLGFNFNKVGGAGPGTSYSEDDGWSVPEDDRRPTLEDMHWQQATLDLLAGSVWPVHRTPAEARAQQETPAEPSVG